MNRLIWFRKDLRLHDNPALWHACNDDNEHSVYAVFCLTRQQWQQHGMGQRQQQLLINAVNELHDELRKLNIALLIINSETFGQSLTDLHQLCTEWQIDEVYLNLEYEFNEVQRDQQWFNDCQQQNIRCHSFHDQCIIPPGEVLTGSDQMFKVFSPFKRAWQRQFSRFNQQPLPAPTARPAQQAVLTAGLQQRHQPHATVADPLWSASEQQAHQQLNDFLDGAVTEYHRGRDFPAQPATSQLSCALALGLISPRQCLYSVWQQNACELAGGEPGRDSWINELIWREFYRHLMAAYPQLCRHKAFKPDTENVPWRYSEKDFSAWCEGRTGYPIVDAAMRQLQQTGWMHNRLRMISAMFLTKHLLIDWRWGEAWFASQLVDFDLASNNGGWQWSASTGADGAPYFRIFNPITQSQKFDSDGEFIGRFVAELLPLAGRQRHQPNASQRRACGYPDEIVAHKFGRERALAAFKGEPFAQLSSNNGTDKQSDLFHHPNTDPLSNEGV